MNHCTVFLPFSQHYRCSQEKGFGSTVTLTRIKLLLTINSQWLLWINLIFSSLSIWNVLYQSHFLFILKKFYQFTLNNCPLMSTFPYFLIKWKSVYQCKPIYSFSFFLYYPPSFFFFKTYISATKYWSNHKLRNTNNTGYHVVMYRDSDWQKGRLQERQT